MKKLLVLLFIGSMFAFVTIHTVEKQSNMQEEAASLSASAKAAPIKQVNAPSQDSLINTAQTSAYPSPH